MINALNLTMPLKQDAESQKKLSNLVKKFSSETQPLIDAALRQSELVHFARVLIIDNKYIQVITEYDGDKEVYTDIFRIHLSKIFEIIFSLVESEKTFNWDELNDRDEFYKVAKSFNLKALGDHPDDDQGYLFCAFNRSVKELKALPGI